MCKHQPSIFSTNYDLGAGGGHQVFLASQPISARLRRSPTPQDPHADGGRIEVLRSCHEQAPFRQADRFVVVCSCLYELTTKRSYKAKKLKCLVFFCVLNI